MAFLIRASGMIKGNALMGGKLKLHDCRERKSAISAASLSEPKVNVSGDLSYGRFCAEGNTG